MAVKYKETFENGTPLISLRVRSADSKFKYSTERRRKWARPDVGVCFLSFFVLIVGCHGYQEQRFAMEPQDQVGFSNFLTVFLGKVLVKVGKDFI